MKLVLMALALVLAANAPAAPTWTKAGWYRIEIFPALKILSARFASEATCRKTLPAVEDGVVRCVRLSKKGDEVERAIEFFADEIKKNPRNATAMICRGVLYERKGQNDDARKEYSAAIEASPDDYGGYIARGKLHQKLGKRDAAIADYREALGRNPGRSETVAMLEDALKSLGAEP